MIPYGLKTVFMCPMTRRLGGDYVRGTRFTVFDSPREYQDVFGFEKYFLVDRNEEGYCGVCSSL